MAVIKAKIYAYWRPNIVTRYKRFFGFVATVIWDGYELKVVSKDEEIRGNLSTILNSVPDSLKKRLPLPSGEFNLKEAEIGAISIEVHSAEKEIKLMDDGRLITYYGGLALYKKTPQSEVEIIFEKKEDCYIFFIISSEDLKKFGHFFREGKNIYGED